MSHRIQICVDATDPHTLADWWAETLQWDLEPSDEAMIRSLVERGVAREEDTLVHRGALVWRLGQAITPPEGVPGARILFQVVPEPKTVKNRLHLDVFVGEDGKDAVRDALLARGAAYVSSHQVGPSSWHVMTDPEGNEFCVN